MQKVYSGACLTWVVCTVHSTVPLPSINPLSSSIQKEEAELQAQKDAERQHQEREILKLQQEEERHLRKKVFMTQNSMLITE